MSKLEQARSGRTCNLLTFVFCWGQRLWRSLGNLFLRNHDPPPGKSWHFMPFLLLLLSTVIMTHGQSMETVEITRPIQLVSAPRSCSTQMIQRRRPASDDSSPRSAKRSGLNLACKPLHACASNLVSKVIHENMVRRINIALQDKRPIVLMGSG